MRVLHLLAPASAGDEGVLACAASMHSTPEHLHRVLLIGGSAEERRTWSLGVHTTDRVQPLLRSAARSARRARMWMDATRTSGFEPTIVQSWCGDSALLGERLGGLLVSAMRSATLLRVPSEGLLTELQACAVRTRFSVYNPGMRRVLARAWGRDGAGVRVLDPGAEHAAISAPDRGDARAELGVEDEDKVIALVCHDPLRTDAMNFAFVLGLLYVAGQRVVGQMPQDARNHRRAARFVRAHARRWGAVMPGGSLTQTVAAADAVVFDDGGLNVMPGPWMRAVAACAGVPLIVPGGAAMTGGTACIACERTPASIVHAVLGALGKNVHSHDVAARHADRLGGTQTLARLWREMLNMPEAAPVHRSVHAELTA